MPYNLDKSFIMSSAVFCAMGFILKGWEFVPFPSNNK